MAKYEPKHLKTRKRKVKKTRIRNKKHSFIIIGIAFMTFVSFSTLYSVFVYPTTLPQVTVMAPEKMVMSSTGATHNFSIPKECIFYEPGTEEYYCYVVVKEEGGFGPKYYAVRNVLKTQKYYFKDEEANVPFSGATYNNLPYVKATMEPLYNYCEIGIVLK